MILNFNNYSITLDASAINLPIISATVKRKDTGAVLGQLRAIKLPTGKVTYNLLSIIKGLELYPTVPDFNNTTIEFYNTDITVTMNAVDYDYTVMPTAATSTSTKLNQNDTSIRISDYYQAVYYLVLDNKLSNEQLYASVNDAEKMKVDSFKILSTQSYLTINYHKYFETLGVSEYDTVVFSFDNLPFVETINLDRVYAQFPSQLVAYNDNFFFESFPIDGDWETAELFTKSAAELEDGLMNFYNENTEKVVLNTGNMNYLRKMRIVNAMKRNTTYISLDGTALQKAIYVGNELPKFHSKNADDNLKLEFKLSQIERF